MKKDIFINPHYRGKHIVMIAGKIFTAKTAKDAPKLFDRLTKKYPGKTPTITYVPKEDTLILSHRFRSVNKRERDLMQVMAGSSLIRFLTLLSN